MDGADAGEEDAEDEWMDEEGETEDACNFLNQQIRHR